MNSHGRYSRTYAESESLGAQAAQGEFKPVQSKYTSQGLMVKNPTGWLYKVNQFFTYNKTPNH